MVYTFTVAYCSAHRLEVSSVNDLSRLANWQNESVHSLTTLLGGFYFCKVSKLRTVAYHVVAKTSSLTQFVNIDCSLGTISRFLNVAIASAIHSGLQIKQSCRSSGPH